MPVKPKTDEQAEQHRAAQIDHQRAEREVVRGTSRDDAVDEEPARALRSRPTGPIANHTGKAHAIVLTRRTYEVAR